MCRTPLLDTLEHAAQKPPDHAKAVLKRANAKDLSYHVARALYGEAVRCGDNEKGSGQLYERKSMARYYGRAMGCMDLKVQHADGDLSTHYCGARCCVQCNRIRTAQGILGYEDVISEWGQRARFGTATLTNCTADELPSVIEAMTGARYNSIQSIRRTHDLPFRALFKLEVTYNREADTYHPHYHFLTDGEESAHAFNEAWMARAPREAAPWAQDVRRCDPGSFRELMKYSTKIITTDKDEGRRGIHVPSLHVIYRTLKGKKTLQPFGIKPKAVVLSTDSEDLSIQQTTRAFKRIGEAINWQYVPDYQDWVDMDTGECLTGYERPDQIDLIISKMEGREQQQPYPLNEDLYHENRHKTPC